MMTGMANLIVWYLKAESNRWNESTPTIRMKLYFLTWEDILKPEPTYGRQAWDEDSPSVLEDEDEDFQSCEAEDEDEDSVL